MTRLYLQLYLTVVASLVVFAIAAGWLWRVLVQVAPPPQTYALASEIAQGALPPADAPHEAQQAALEKLSAGGQVNIALFAPDGQLLFANPSMSAVLGGTSGTVADLLPAGRQRKRAFHHVLELADIARPVEGHQCLLRILRRGHTPP